LNSSILDMFNGMPKIAKPLTDLAVRRLTRPGWHAVGGVAGLLLQVREPAKPGAVIPRSWILRVRIGSERRPIGLGPYPQVSLAQAREQAAKLVLEAKQGVNLHAKKRAQRSALIAAASKNKTFKDCAEAFMEAHSSDYTNEKHRKQWPATLKTYAYPIIGNMLVADIAMRDVRSVLEQQTIASDGTRGKLWFAKTETAKRLLGRIKTVLDYAIVNEYRSGTNPAQWTGFLDTQLPSPKKISETRHQPALPYDQAASFMHLLRQNQSISSKALQFLILTGVRSGSVRLAEWSEIDFTKKLWTIPPAHTKARNEHRVPLQPQAIKLLKSLPKLAGTKIIFPSVKGGPLSDMAVSQLMRGMHERGDFADHAVPHGFRSTFRDWAAEKTNYPDELRKIASMHTVSDSVKAAYERTDLLDKRRRLMNDWANFLDRQSKQSPKVTPIRRKA
jgi:integrase